MIESQRVSKLLGNTNLHWFLIKRFMKWNSKVDKSIMITRSCLINWPRTSYACIYQWWAIMSLDNGLLSFRRQAITQFSDDASSIRSPEKKMDFYSLNSSKKMHLELSPAQCWLCQSCIQGRDKLSQPNEIIARNYTSMLIIFHKELQGIDMYPYAHLRSILLPKYHNTNTIIILPITGYMTKYWLGTLYEWRRVLYQQYIIMIQYKLSVYSANNSSSNMVGYCGMWSLGARYSCECISRNPFNHTKSNLQICYMARLVWLFVSHGAVW